MRQTGVVPRTVCIDSAGDPRLADYTRLTDVSLRTHLEAEHGLFIAEGSKVKDPLEFARRLNELLIASLVG